MIGLWVSLHPTEMFVLQNLRDKKNFFHTDTYAETGYSVEVDLQYSDELKEGSKTFNFVLKTKKAHMDDSLITRFPLCRRTLDHMLKQYLRWDQKGKLINSYRQLNFWWDKEWKLQR